MKHRTQSRYGAPSSVVLKAFSDKQFHVQKMAALKLPKYEVLGESSSGAEYRIRTERHVPVDAPAAIKKFIPAVSKVVNEEVWNAQAKSGRVNAQPQGVPVEIGAAVSFKDEGSGCVVTYDWEIKAKIPFVGGVLEKFVAGDMDQRMAEETRVGAGLLKAYGG